MPKIASAMGVGARRKGERAVYFAATAANPVRALTAGAVRGTASRTGSRRRRRRGSRSRPRRRPGPSSRAVAEPALSIHARILARDVGFTACDGAAAAPERPRGGDRVVGAGDQQRPAGRRGAAPRRAAAPRRNRGSASASRPAASAEPRPAPPPDASEAPGRPVGVRASAAAARCRRRASSAGARACDHRRGVLVGEDRQAGDDAAAVGDLRQRLGQGGGAVGVVGGVDDRSAGRSAIRSSRPGIVSVAATAATRSGSSSPRKASAAARARAKLRRWKRARARPAAARRPGSSGAPHQAGAALGGGPLGQRRDRRRRPGPGPGSSGRAGPPASRPRSPARSPPATRCGRARSRSAP